MKEMWQDFVNNFTLTLPSKSVVISMDTFITCLNISALHVLCRPSLALKPFDVVNADTNAKFLGHMRTSEP